MRPGNNWYDRVLRQDRRCLSPRPERVDALDLLYPPLRVLVEHVLSRMAAAGAPMLVWETYRSQTRQERLYRMGRSRVRTSTHQYGLACDLVFDLGAGEPSWRGPWGLLGGFSYEYGLTWGGDWDSDPSTRNRFDDLPHIQFCSLSEQAHLFDGSWFPVEP